MEIKYINKIHPFREKALLWFLKDVLSEEQRDKAFELCKDKYEIYNELKKSNNDFLIKEYNCLFEISVEKLN